MNRSPRVRGSGRGPAKANADVFVPKERFGPSAAHDSPNVRLVSMTTAAVPTPHSEARRTANRARPHPVLYRPRRSRIRPVVRPFQHLSHGLSYRPSQTYPPGCLGRPSPHHRAGSLGNTHAAYRPRTCCPEAKGYVGSRSDSPAGRARADPSDIRNKWGPYTWKPPTSVIASSREQSRRRHRQSKNEQPQRHTSGHCFRRYPCQSREQ
jgi:hypothetical protein